MKDLEKETQEIIEFIYSCGEYNELVKAKLDIHKDILDTLIEKKGKTKCLKEFGFQINNKTKIKTKT